MSVVSIVITIILLAAFVKYAWSVLAYAFSPEQQRIDQITKG
ncbi:MAG: hypothetical protein NT121_20205 [Chloroflexi bacterium]|nr:hypothetical protein [Chloroflexota bacterium]